MGLVNLEEETGQIRVQSLPYSSWVPEEVHTQLSSFMPCALHEPSIFKCPDLPVTE